VVSTACFGALTGQQPACMGAATMRPAPAPALSLGAAQAPRAAQRPGAHDGTRCTSGGRPSVAPAAGSSAAAPDPPPAAPNCSRSFRLRSRVVAKQQGSDAGGRHLCSVCRAVATRSGARSPAHIQLPPSSSMAQWFPKSTSAKIPGSASIATPVSASQCCVASKSQQHICSDQHVPVASQLHLPQVLFRQRKGSQRRRASGIRIYQRGGSRRSTPGVGLDSTYFGGAFFFFGPAPDAAKLVAHEGIDNQRSFCMLHHETSPSASTKAPKNLVDVDRHGSRHRPGLKFTTTSSSKRTSAVSVRCRWPIGRPRT